MSLTVVKFLASASARGCSENNRKCDSPTTGRNNSNSKQSANFSISLARSGCDASSERDQGGVWKLLFPEWSPWGRRINFRWAEGRIVSAAASAVCEEVTGIVGVVVKVVHPRPGTAARPL